jgi:hypothetical protein
MNNEIVLALWIKHVKSNYARLKHVMDNLSTNEQLLCTREMLAEMGKEVTPDELREFSTLLKETLEYIDDAQI